MIKLPNIFSFVVDNSVKIETKTINLCTPKDQFSIEDILILHFDTVAFIKKKGSIIRACHDLKTIQGEYMCSKTFQVKYGSIVEGDITYKVFTR